jgi:chromosome segregation ATPase
MTTAAPTDLAQEIAQLQADLATAERARIRPEDQRVTELQQKLFDAQHALQLQQELESQAAAEQQHAQQLVLLVQLENEISKAKAEVNTLKAMLTELPQRLSRAHFDLSQLLRSHAQLKLNLKG